MTTEDVDLFTEKDPESVDATNPLAALVGEGKKFKTPEDLAKGKLESDAFIKQLQAELAKLREDFNGRIKLEEFMDRLEKTSTTQAPSNQGTTPNEQVPAGNIPKSITKEDIESLLAAREREATEKANVRHVAEVLKSTFGDNFQSVVNTRAKELDLDTAYLADLAKTRPSAFLKIMNTGKAPEPGPSGNVIPKSSVSATSFNSQTAAFKKFSDFEKIRRENPKLYHSKDVQAQMYALTKEHGDAFLKS